MIERLNPDKRNPICSIATIYDHLLLNNYKIDSNLIYLACINTFVLIGKKDIKGLPLFFIAPIENAVDIKYFRNMGFELENIDLKLALQNNNNQNIIAYFDYYTLLSKENKPKRYNICPIHTTLIIESVGSEWILNEVKMEEEQKVFTARPYEKLIVSNNLELHPYSVDGIAYRILPNLSQAELEKQTVKQIEKNFLQIVKEMKEKKEIVVDNDVTLFYGLYAYNELISYFNYLIEIYKNKDINESKYYNIMLMVFRRFLLPMSGERNFFRSEMTEAFNYYSHYMGNPYYSMVGKKLMLSANKWKDLSTMVSNVATKKDKIPDLEKIIKIIEFIKETEHSAVLELERAINWRED